MAPKKKYSQLQMANAVTDINNNGISKKAAALKYGVPYKTLYNKMTGISPENCKMGPDPYLTKEEEDIIVEWILSLAKRHFPVNKDQLLDSVQKIVISTGRQTPFANGRPGVKWFKSFQKRHPEISQRQSQNLTASREAVTETQIRSWFSEISDYIKSKNLEDVLQDPQRIFNADESAFFLQPGGGKVLVRKGEKNVYTSAGNEKENLTVLVTANAAGTLAPPMIVFDYERIPGNISCQIPSTWGVGRSDTGWMCGSTFFEYISNVFHPWLVANNIPLPIIFFLDGHNSHLTAHLSEFCTQHQIEVIALYPNSTHLLQPMDLAVFRPLKMYWAQQCAKFKIDNNGDNVRKEQFSPLFKNALEQLPIDAIKNGFRAGGLFPFGADYVDFKKIRKCGAEEIRKPNVDNFSFLNKLEKEIVAIFGVNKLNLFKKCYFIKRQELHEMIPVEDVTLYTVWAKSKHAKAEAEFQVQDQNKTIESDTNYDDMNNNNDQPLANSSEVMGNCVSKSSLVLPHANIESPKISIENDMNDDKINHNSNQPLAYDEEAMDQIEDTLKYQKQIVKSFEKTPVKTFANHMQNAKGIIIPTPFKKACFWPGPEKDKKRRLKEKIPSAITSEAWKAYNKNKELKKRQIEEEKQRKKNERETKRKEKEEMKKKQKIPKTTVKKRKLSTSSETEAEISFAETDCSSDYDLTECTQYITTEYLDDDILNEASTSLSTGDTIIITDDIWNQPSTSKSTSDIKILSNETVKTVLDDKSGCIKIVPTILKNENEEPEIKIGLFILGKFDSKKGKKCYHYVCRVEDEFEEKFVVQGFKSLKNSKDKYVLIPKDISIIERSDILEILPYPTIQNNTFCFSSNIKVKEA